MEKTLYTTFERYCRLCAEEQEVTLMLFGTEATDMLLVEKLRKYLHIEIDKNDKFPKNICIKCCSKLRSHCEFVDLVRKAQDYLHALSSTIVQSDKIKYPITTKEEAEEITEICIDPMDVLNMRKEPSEPLFSYAYADEIVTLKLMPNDKQDQVKRKNRRGSEFPTERDKKKRFSCMICNKGFVAEQSLKNHSWIHIKEEGRYCFICQRTFTWKTELETHMRSHKPRGYKCNICARRFRIERSYLQHMAIHKSLEKSHSCNVCGRSYATVTGLKTHSITHSPVKPFQCFICQKKFKRNQELKFHMNYHTGERPYKCPFCDKRFASSGNCYTHKNRVHPNMDLHSKGIDGEAADAKKSKKPSFFCPYCKGVFNRRENYTFHMFQHTGEKPLKCVRCPKAFLTERSLSSHYDSEHPNFTKPVIVMPVFCRIKRKWCY